MPSEAMCLLVKTYEPSTSRKTIDAVGRPISQTPGHHKVSQISPDLHLAILRMLRRSQLERLSGA